MFDFQDAMFIIYRFSMIYEIAFIFLFTPLRYNKRISLSVASLFYIAATILDGMNFIKIADIKIGTIENTVIQSVLIQVMALFLAKYRDLRTVFNVLCSADFVLIGNIIGMVVYINNNNIFKAAVIENIMHLSLIVCLCVILLEKYKKEQEIGNIGWQYICVFPAMFYVVVYSMGVWPNSIPDNPDMLIPILMTLILMVILFCFLTLNRRKLRLLTEKEDAMQFLEKYAQGILNEAETIQKHQRELACQRHDLRHRYRMIDKYLELGEYDKIHNLIVEMDGEIEKTKQHKYCDNVLVSSILSIYAARAEKKGVKFVCMADVPEDFEKARDFGFATMLSNLLENAILAAEKLGQKKREVFVKMMPKKEMLIMRIENGIEGELKLSDDTGLPLSVRGSGHGYGLLSVSDYAKKHGDLLEINCKNGKVIVQYIVSM